MSWQVECESRLLNLQHYVPFLERIVGRLAGSNEASKVEQRQKMTSLLTVLTSSGQQ